MVEIRNAEPGLSADFVSLPTLCLVLMPSFTIVAANDACLKLIAPMAVNTEIVGRNLSELLPDNRPALLQTDATTMLPTPLPWRRPGSLVQ